MLRHSCYNHQKQKRILSMTSAYTSIGVMTGNSLDAYHELYAEMRECERKVEEIRNRGRYT